MEDKPILLNRIDSSEVETYGIYMIGCIAHTSSDATFLKYSTNKNNIVYFGPASLVSLEIKQRIIAIDEKKRVQELMNINSNVFDIINGKSPSTIYKNYINDKFECTTLEHSFSTALTRIGTEDIVLIFLSKDRKL